jgi:hypothetical protein
MPSATYALIRQAVAQKQCIGASYRGYDREMCPTTIGYSKTGVEQALFYQYGGYSSSGLAEPGSPDNWRCIPLDGLSNVRVIAGTFQTGPNHSKAQTCVARIDVEIQY